MKTCCLIKNKIRCLLNIIIFKLALMDFGMEGKSASHFVINCQEAYT